MSKGDNFSVSSLIPFKPIFNYVYLSFDFLAGHICNCMGSLSWVLAVRNFFFCMFTHIKKATTDFEKCCASAF